MKGFLKSRIAGGLIFILMTTVLLGGLIIAQNLYANDEPSLTGYVICGASWVFAILASVCFWVRKIQTSFYSALLSAIIAMIGAYGYILPNLTELNTAERLAIELDVFAPNTESQNVHSPHFTEPSLVYHIGKNINLKSENVSLKDGKLVILNTRREETVPLSKVLTKSAKNRNRCIAASNPVKGFNYSKGTPLTLVILKEVPC